MAPPAWAYDVANFCSPPDEDFICSICHKVLCDPAQSPCQHVFCKGCIVVWLQSYHNCPICRSSLTKAEIFDAAFILKSLIDKMLVRCHISENGCDAKISIDNTENHSEICPFESVKCKTDPCQFMTQRSMIGNHETSECDYRVCDICNFSLQANSTHNCVKELKKALLKGWKTLQDQKAELENFYLQANNSTHNCVEEIKKAFQESEKTLKDHEAELEKYNSRMRTLKENLETFYARNQKD